MRTVIRVEANTKRDAGFVVVIVDARRASALHNANSEKEKEREKKISVEIESETPQPLRTALTVSNSRWRSRK